MKDDSTYLFLWSAVSGFAVGIAVRSVLMIGWSEVFFVLLLAGILVPLPRRGVVKRRGGPVFVCVFLVAVACGIARMQLSLKSGDVSLSPHIGEHVTLFGRVSTEPDAREKNTLLILAVDSSPSHILVKAPPHTPVSYGDTVEVSGDLRLPENFDTTEGRTFAYKNFLAKDSVLYTLERADVQVKKEWRGSRFIAVSLAAKQFFVKGIRSVLPEPEAGLAAGITVGDKRSVGSELSTVFQRDSLTHMLVLSGYNITIVVATVMIVLASMPRRVQYVGGLVVISFFVIISGGAASAVRAAVMALVALIARATYRLFNATRALFAAVFVLLLWNPWLLLFDPGFQLSVLATFGLVYITPLIETRIGWVTERYGLREVVASTGGAQLAVLPLLLYQNGLLSLVALPANVATLTFVPLAMLLSFIAACGGMLVGHSALPLALPAYGILAYIITAAQFFAALPFAALSLPSFSVWWLLASYVVMIIAVCRLQSQKQNPDV